MRVLYVSHTAAIGGGEHSLLELLKGLPEDVEATVACPEGDLAAEVRALQVLVFVIPHAAPSFRLHPVLSIRGVAGAARASTALLRRARHTRPDLIHANSVRAGLISLPLARLGGPPLLVHVRDCLPESLTANLVRRAIGSSTSLVVANSDYTAASFARNTTHAATVRTVYNSVDLDRFDPSRISRAEARSQLGLGPSEAVLGVVAQITPWKAQDDAIRTLAHLRRRGVNARLLLVGEPKFATGSETLDNVRFALSLEGLVGELSLDGAVSFLGERSDVPEILAALDLVLVPSWEEPFGRSVIEAMAMAIPVIATNVGGPAEIVTDGVEGILLPPRSPERWAEDAARLLETPDLSRRMGTAGRRTAASRFDRQTYVRSVLAAYRETLETSTG
jgi:glycosyltransferase involved in cell wall biosynthesis